ncbi:MAG: DUF1570 domain-containing protein [Phycisphaerales bacterium]|nr:DUF1570 domain-containing protein [Phycisphaerales bacterium]
MAALMSSGCRTPSEALRVAREPWPAAEREGVRLSTEHFDLYTTVEDGELRSALPVLAEAAHQQYARLLPPAPGHEGARLTTYVFATRGEWDRFTRARFPQSYAVYQYIRAGGFTEDGTAVLVHSTPAATLATLAHEGWHQYVQTRTSCRPPAWLNEGLACYLESFDFTRQPPRPLPLGNSFRLEHLRSALAESKAFSLHELLDTDAGEVLLHNHSGITQTYYAGVWGLVSFLRHGSEGRHAAALDRLLADLADGSLPIRVRAAMLTREGEGGGDFGRAVFSLYFGAADKNMEQAYQAYLRELAGF